MSARTPARALLEPPFQQWNPRRSPCWNPVSALEAPPSSIETPFQRSVGRGSTGGSNTFEPILNEASGQWYTLFPTPTNTSINVVLK